jgi:hypothetical protein
MKTLNECRSLVQRKGFISMKEPNEANRYHIRRPTTQATYQDLEKWAVNPNCIEIPAIPELATQGD